MNVVFLKSFQKDLKKKAKLKHIILELEDAATLSNIKNICKIKEHPQAYRIRLGAYRIGLYKEGNRLKLVRILKKKDIYKLFP